MTAARANQDQIFAALTRTANPCFTFHLLAREHPIGLVTMNGNDESDEEHLASLVSMGFDVVKARDALEANEGNMDQAVGYLLSGKSREKQVASSQVARDNADKKVSYREGVSVRPPRRKHEDRDDHQYYRHSLHPPTGLGTPSRANNVLWSNRNEKDTSIPRRHGLEEFEDGGLNESKTFRASQKVSHAAAAQTTMEPQSRAYALSQQKSSVAYAPHSVRQRSEPTIQPGAQAVASTSHSARRRSEPTLQPGAQAVSGPSSSVSPMIQPESPPSGRGDDHTYLATAELVSDRDPEPLVMASPMSDEESTDTRDMKKFYIFGGIVALVVLLAGVGASVAVSLLLREKSSPVDGVPSLAPSQLLPTGVPSDVALPPSPTQQEGTTSAPTARAPDSEPPSTAPPQPTDSVTDPPTPQPTDPVTDPPSPRPTPVTDPPTPQPTDPVTDPPTPQPSLDVCATRLPDPDISIDSFSATDFFLNINNWSDYPDDLWDEMCVRVVNYDTFESIVEKCNLSDEDFSFEAPPSVTSVQLVFEDGRCPDSEPYESNVVELERETEPPTLSPTTWVPTPGPPISAEPPTLAPTTWVPTPGQPITGPPQ